MKLSENPSYKVIQAINDKKFTGKEIDIKKPSNS